MKPFIGFIVTTVLIAARSICAQVPHIDYMIADEVKSQLQIHGTFGTDHTGRASIEGVPCSVRFWSDTMVICDLPDSGAGSGGHVIVTQMTGTSNARMLSIFKVNIDHFYWHWLGNQFPPYFGVIFGQRWIVNWRADIEDRNENKPHLISFDASKSSYGTYITGISSVPEYLFPWSDTSVMSDSSISLSGTINLKKSLIEFNIARMYLASVVEPYHIAGFDSIYHPLSIGFDTFGNISGYVDSGINGLTKKSDSLYNQKILFPPDFQNSVSLTPAGSSSILQVLSRPYSTEQSISFLSEERLGDITISLYDIGGRMLIEENLSIPCAGIYKISVNVLKPSIGILVVKSADRIIVKRVIL